MAGTKQESHNMIVQPRDLQLLRELGAMRVIDREQAKIVAGFRSTTRANTRLLALTRAGLLKRFFLGSGGGRKALYALSHKGAQFADVPQRGPRRRKDEMLVADTFIQHQLAINEVYCAFKWKANTVPQVTFHRWLAFYQPLASGLSLIPDGYVEFQTPSGIDAAFVEVDLGHEVGAVWRQKARNYLQFAVSGEYQRQFGQQRFRVLVLVNSERRMQSIRKAVALVTEKLFWFATLESVRSDQIFQPIWLRPTGDEPKPLFEINP
jgi:hypothetical protein